MHDGKLQLIAGARENRTRPAIDPLFRSAAVVRGARTIGIVLSGHLDDGAAGLAAIEACGGATLVQSPEDAMATSMPQAALAALGSRVAAVASARELGFLAADIAHRPVEALRPIPEALVREHDIFLRAGDMIDDRRVSVRRRESWFTVGKLARPRCRPRGIAEQQSGQFVRRHHVVHLVAVSHPLRLATPARARRP